MKEDSKKPVGVLSFISTHRNDSYIDDDLALIENTLHEEDDTSNATNVNSTTTKLSPANLPLMTNARGNSNIESSNISKTEVGIKKSENTNSKRGITA